MDWLKKNKVLAIVGCVLLFVGIASASLSSSSSSSAQPAAVVLSQQQTLPTASQAPQTVSQPVQGQYYDQQSQQTAPTLSNDNYYTNSSGNSVHSPAYTDTGTAPSGASAQCGDGSYSFSQHHSGTCSHHGGVIQWLQ